MARRIADKYRQWEAQCDARFSRVKANEEELNRLFIEIYGLQGELTPEVEDRDVTVRRANLQREIKSLISYAVGCIFGRYSVDADGICYAGGAWDESKYQTVLPVADNLLPVWDEDADEDLLGRFVSFVEAVYGRETLEENLGFIADALGGNGTPRQVIGRYLLRDFYADHLKTYQKKPIYWLFSSGRKNGFKALIYLHRYQPRLMQQMLEAVHAQQQRYRSRLKVLEETLATAAAAEKRKLRQQIFVLQEQLLETDGFEKRLQGLVRQQIEIDLDEGVTANYAKLQDVLEIIR